MADNNFVVRDGLLIENITIGDNLHDIVVIGTDGVVKRIPRTDFNADYYNRTQIQEFFGGTTTITGYNKTNWDTAFGWGNHSTAGYLTSLPSHTHEYLPLAGGTLTGEVYFQDDGEGITFNGGARIYKKVGSGLTLRRHSADTNPRIESYNGASSWEIWHQGNLTNLNQLTNGPGYLTSVPLFDRVTNGLVPMPGGSTTTRYLREDGTWVTPTVYTNMTLLELNAGSVTLERVISAKTLNDWLNAKNYITGVTWAQVTGKPTLFPPEAHTHTFASLTSKPTTIAGYGITDAMTTAHAANVITSTNITNWNTAFGWGNHAGLYSPLNHNHDGDYVNVVGDTMSGKLTISSSGFGGQLRLHRTELSNVAIEFTGAVNTHYVGYDTNTGDFGFTNQIIAFGGAPAKINSITGDITANKFIKTGGTAGQFLKANGTVDSNTYLTSFTETDPTVPSHVKSITTTEKSNWNTAFGWGNHASAGYLTSFTETDPTVPTHVKSITTTEKANWNTAFGWGNHANAGYLTALPTHDHFAVNDGRYLRLIGGTLTGPLNFTPGTAGTAIASVFGGNTTQKSYINFNAASGSNDPGFIVHETSGTASVANNGVIHISPSDDNARGDYVSIHGTNDPETIKLHTDGFIETPALIQANGFKTTNGTAAQFLKADGTIDTNSYVLDQDNEVRKITISAGDLPVNYTKADIVAHLNTLGVTKTEIETIVVDIVGGDETLTIGWGNVTGTPATYPPSNHDHDDRYFTESESDLRFAPISHTHNYDNYQGWNIQVNGGASSPINSLQTVNLIAGTGMTLTQTGSSITLNSSPAYNVFNRTDNGLVPTPGGATSTRYLREDGTWVIPTNTTYSAMSLAEINAGTATTSRVLTAKTLADWSVTKFVGITDHDTTVRKIDIASTSLPVDYTEADVVAHLNTIGFTKSDMETLIITVDGGGGMSTGSGTSYTHPSKAWVDKTVLSGATVISNLMIDEFGHPTDWATRTISKADIGLSSVENYSRADNDARYLIKNTDISHSNVANSTWPYMFTTAGAGNSNSSGFWVNTDGTPDMRLRGTNSTVRVLLSSNATNSYVQTNGGNFGVGTTAPGYKLDVAGTFRATGFSVLAGRVDIANPLATSSAINIGAASPTYMKFWETNAFGMSFGYNGAGAGADNKLEVLSDANTPIVEIFNDGRITSTGTITASGGQVVTSSTGTNHVAGMWQGTQAQYDAIGTKNPNTLYFIK